VADLRFDLACQQARKYVDIATGGNATTRRIGRLG